jgi:hypothetical protein
MYLLLGGVAPPATGVAPPATLCAHCFAIRGGLRPCADPCFSPVIIYDDNESINNYCRENRVGGGGATP